MRRAPGWTPPRAEPSRVVELRLGPLQPEQLDAVRTFLEELHVGHVAVEMRRLGDPEWQRYTASISRSLRYLWVHGASGRPGAVELVEVIGAWDREPMLYVSAPGLEVDLEHTAVFAPGAQWQIRRAPYRSPLCT